MADPTTTNKLLPQPSRGSDDGSWTAPYNSVFGIVDNSFGGTATVAVTSSPVTLLSSQYQCAFINITGALTANVAITLPAVGSFYTVINDTTNSSAFVVTMLTTASSGRQIGVPQSVTDIMTDGANVRFRGLPPVGTYWNYPGAAVPLWVSACTAPPWVICNGTTFSSASYPALAAIIGSTTLPDLNGRGHLFLDDGAGIYSSAAIYTGVGAQSATLTQANLPNVNFEVVDAGHSHTNTNNFITGQSFIQGGAGTNGSYTTAATITINSAVTGISVGSGGSDSPFGIIPPAIISGITMIRAG